MRNSILPVVKPFLKRREQILVVEDDVDSCELLGMVLHEAGYSVDMAHDGYEALQMAARRRPDVVLSDIQMPGLDGLQLARRIHVADPKLPVVLTTSAENTKDLVTSVERYGAVACLQKPMNLEELLWTLDTVLAASHQRGRRPGAPLVH
jgi:two-component system response regulator ResD